MKRAWNGGTVAAGALTLALIGCGSLDSSKKSEPRDELSDLRISEIHYHPLGQDTLSDDLYEFVELHNAGTKRVSLARVGFTDGIDYTFQSGDGIDAGGYLVLAANAERFKQRYGFAPFGTYTGNLKNSGETVTLTDLPAERTIDSVSYSDIAPWPERADGRGPSLVPTRPDQASSWKASFAVHGSPGKADPTVVLVNEIATHTDPPEKDAVELFNPNAFEVDIGGWYLSDSRKQLFKYRLPSNTRIGAGAYLVIDADAFNKDSTAPGAFSFSEHGDGVYLTADSTGCAGFCHGFEYGTIENGADFGRYVTSWGDEHFVAQKKNTLGAVNAGPKLSPVVLGEIMYHPLNDSDEYVELINVSADTVALYDTAYPDNTYKLRGFGFTFPKGVKLAPNEIVVVLSASADVDSFRTAHALESARRVFTTAGAKLGNTTDTLTLEMPEEPYDEGNGLVVPYKVLERIAYHDGSPWPKDADGLGQALIRKDLRAYGDDPANWAAGNPTPGKR